MTKMQPGGRELLLLCLVGGGVAGVFPEISNAGPSSGSGALAAPDAQTEKLEDIKSSQTTVLEPQPGELAAVAIGIRVFADSNESFDVVPDELLGRRFIRSKRERVSAVCRQAGYVYGVARSHSPQAKELTAAGFAPVNLLEFKLRSDDGGIVSTVYQKAASLGDRLEFSGGVILIFGPEELGGVPYSQLHSLRPPVFLPDGSEFKTWEVPLHFQKTYYVEQSDPRASDANPGTQELPFKTINRAAQILEPGERVLVGTGVYRECVRPARGGTDPAHMISYEAAPGAKVVIKGSEILNVQWEKSAPWILDTRFPRGAPSVKDVWVAHLPPQLFVGFNPFETANFRQADQMPWWNSGQEFSNYKATLFLKVCALLFQNGKRLRQVTRYSDLYFTPGAFWVEPNGLTIHVSPLGGIDPSQAEWEATTREQIFAPQAMQLGYIRVKGFTMQHAANTFPFPHRGALSTRSGHHWIIEDNTIEWVNSVAIDIGDPGEPLATPRKFIGHHIVRGNTLNDIGISGITGPGQFDTLIEKNVLRRNCWHDVEFLAECAAIKTHHNLNVLIRQNVILETIHGTGIWIDSVNSNTRISQNTVVGTGTNNGQGPGQGAIYVEASMFPNLVDHNFVWGSTETNGIYVYTSSKLTIANNFVGNCALAGIRLIDMPGRGEIPSGGNTVVNNIVTGNGWDIGFFSPDNASDFNLIGSARLPNPFRLGKVLGTPGLSTSQSSHSEPEEVGLNEWQTVFGFDQHSTRTKISADFNLDTLELEWSVEGSWAPAKSMANMNRDFWERPTPGGKAGYGPFGAVPSTPTRVSVDPRHAAE